MIASARRPDRIFLSTTSSPISSRLEASRTRPVSVGGTIAARQALEVPCSQRRPLRSKSTDRSRRSYISRLPELVSTSSASRLLMASAIG